MPPSFVDDSMHQQLHKYTTALRAFTNSSSSFRILHSIGSGTAVPARTPQTLYILDSSFNPPTLAHLHIATSAILHDSQSVSPPQRLLLLLATQNADKAPKPAPFEQRLVLMTIFALDLLNTLKQTKGDTESEKIGVDIGVTKLPYFHSKALAIEESGVYSSNPTQVHLTGYDTLIRILDPKYYPPSHTLQPLEPFLSKHRLRVAYRTDDDWGSKKAQIKFLQELAEGKMEHLGGRSEWVSEGRIELVDGRKEDEAVVSSTKVRVAVKNDDKEALKTLVTDGVADWCVQEKLYLDDI